jgi:hypothetical protein
VGTGGGLLADDPRLDRFIASLDASFDARLTRAEETAADDLALSLEQDRSLFEALRVAGPLELRLADGATAPVTRLGRDYVAAGASGGVLVPLTEAVLAGSGDATPSLDGRTLLEVARAWVRTGRRVRVTTHATTVAGRVVRASQDHLALVEGGRSYLVAMSAIVLLNLDPDHGSRGDAT